MDILHVVQGYTPALGGTEYLIQRVSEELVHQFGDRVTVFTTNCYNGEAFFSPHLPRMPTGEEEINGVKVHRFDVRSIPSRLARMVQWLPYRLRLPGNEWLRTVSGGPIVPGLERAIREHPADVIAASSFPLMHMFAAERAARATGRPVVLHGGLHPVDTWGFNRQMIFEAIQKADRYIANTGYEAEYVAARGADIERVETIGVGVDLERFASVPTGEAKRRYGLEGYPVVSFVGQLGAHKGVDTLLRAMPEVWRVFPEVRFLLAGGRTLFAPALQRLLDDLPRERQEQVVLRYNFPEEEKPFLFAASDVFAYPSGYESFGIAYLEAWACRKPVIGCRQGAVPWVIHEGKDGLLVPYQKAPLLADAILLLLANPRWSRAMGESGYQKVAARYTWPEIGRRFRTAYQRALEQRVPYRGVQPTEAVPQ